MKRKPVAHNRQKSTDVNSRRNPGKLVKMTNERGIPQTPPPLSFQLNVPGGLKDILTASRLLIKENDLVLKLPKEWKHEKPDAERRPHARMILEEFQEGFLSSTPLNEKVENYQLVPVITRGLLVYFEKTLPTNLLYLEERGQYAFIDNRYRSGTNAIIDPENEDEQTVCNWYGADHLLRLLVTLPEILSQSSVDEYSNEIISTYVEHLLYWMDEHKDRLFLAPSEYVAPAPYYKTDIRRRNHGGGTK